jgi:hypothetical protein
MQSAPKQAWSSVAITKTKMKSTAIHEQAFHGEWNYEVRLR